jgi:hypothetical protein
VGAVDGSFHFPEVPATPLEEIVIDWNRMSYINSVGVLTWLKWVHEIHKSQSGVHFIFRNCRHTLAYIMNSVHRFLPVNGKVESIELPLLCEACGPAKNHFIMLHLDTKRPGALDMSEIEALADAQKCEIHGAKLVLDIPALYFKFLEL